LLKSDVSSPDSRGADVLVAGIADPAAAAKCLAAADGAVELSLGGKLDAVTCGPLDVAGDVLATFRADPVFGDTAVVRIAGVDVVVQSRRRPFTTLTDFARLGIKPDTYAAVVVKLGYLFPELRDYAPRHIMAMSPGFGDQRLERLNYNRLKRPIYPLDPHVSFSAD
jgi:microcystin degradation protein MlrC